MSVLRLVMSDYYCYNRIVFFINDRYIQLTDTNYNIHRMDSWSEITDTEIIGLIEGAFRIYYEHFKSKGDQNLSY